MTTEAIIIIVLVLYFSCCGMVEGLNRKLSAKEHLEIEKQLKLLNKPAVKTITTKHGDIYDCVDFFKQPAFDHPLLKDHNYHFEMRPSFANKTRKSKKAKHHFGILGKGCPIGTVPIRRITKEDLIRAKYSIKDTQILYEAGVRTPDDPNRKFHAAGASSIVYHPALGPNQYSSAKMTVKNGPETIQVGWTVNPYLYGDTRTRLFTFFQGNEMSCFNTRCPGFIIVNTQVPLDGYIEPISTQGGPIYEIDLLLEQDDIIGNWWLQFGPDYSEIGFWPPHIFNNLKDFATYVDWGGEALGGEAFPELPDMGTGMRVSGNFAWDAYFHSITILDENYNFDDALFLESISNHPYYTVQDWGLNDQHGHMVSYGGPHKTQFMN